AERVHRNAELVLVAVGRIAVPVRPQRNGAVLRLRPDRGRVRALPVAGRHGAEPDQHIEHFTSVVLAAAHSHQIAERAEIARAHLRARLKAAAAADYGAADEIIFAFRSEHAHTLDVALIAVEARHLGLVADLNA